MTQEQIDILRELLLDEQRKVLSNASQTIRGELELSTDEMADENDLASALYDQGFTLRLRDRERMLMSKIQKALDRLEGEDYGYCEICDDEIEFARLMVRPVTTMCIECKEEAERKERSYAGPVLAEAPPEKTKKKKKKALDGDDDTFTPEDGEEIEEVELDGADDIDDVDIGDDDDDEEDEDEGDDLGADL